MPTYSSGEQYDVIVIGGGPGGAAAATALASRGRSVLVLDRAAFPRFHIGESTLPYLMPALERLGVLADFKARFMPKLGGEIATADGVGRRITFNMLHPGQRPFAFNLDRTESDHALLVNAEHAGARVLQQAAVSSPLLEGRRVTGVEYVFAGQRHLARAPLVLDASGRPGVIARRLRLRRMNPRLRRVSIYQFFEHLMPENNPSDPDDAVFSTHPAGWMWCFPVTPDRLSVGAVVPADALKGRAPEAVFAEHLERAPRVSARIRGSAPVFPACKVESDFCYHAEALSGPGFFLIGDAACFVDPMMSGGVYLAVVTGLQAADAANAILSGREETAVRRDFENFCKTGFDSYFRLVYAFYEECHGDLLCLLGGLAGGLPFSLQTAAGDYWGRRDQPYLAYLRSRPEWRTFEEPFDLVYDCPMYPDEFYTVENVQATFVPPPAPAAAG